MNILVFIIIIIITIRCILFWLISFTEPTADGFEIHFQVNYLSHFLLILHLLPVLKATGNDTRIVLISSLMHRFAKWDPHDMQCFNEKDKMTVYGTTKLYQASVMDCLKMHSTPFGCLT